MFAHSHRQVINGSSRLKPRLVLTSHTPSCQHGVPKSGPLPNFTSNWYVIWNKLLASFNLSFPFCVLKRPQESSRFINARQGKPNRTFFTCWKDDLAPGWVINKECLRSWPGAVFVEENIPEDTKEFMLVTGERLEGNWIVECLGEARNFKKSLESP